MIIVIGRYLRILTVVAPFALSAQAPHALAAPTLGDCSVNCNMHCDPRDLRNPRQIAACFAEQRHCVDVCLHPPPPPIHGTLYPRYFVLTVVYAPPGTQGGRSSSSVSYATGSSTGTSTSSTQSFKQNYSVGVTAGAGFLGNGGQLGLTFSYGNSTSHSDSVDIKKTETTTLQYAGASKDGIDHDRDLIYLWLNPAIDLALTSSAATWTFKGDATADIQYVYVGHLKNPAAMPAGVAQALQNHGITPADYPDILKHDPLAIDSNALQAPRYLPTRFTFTYEPPYSASDPVPVLTYNLSNSLVSTTGSTTTDTYGVKLSIQADAGFLDLAKASLKSEDSWEWTNTSSSSSSSGTSESATLAVGGPSFGYSGSTDVEVFYDTVYKTFAFRMIEGSPAIALAGRVVGANGQALAGQDISITINGRTHQTATDALGNYRFPGALSGDAVVRTGSVGATLTLPTNGARLDLQVQ